MTPNADYEGSLQHQMAEAGKALRAFGRLFWNSLPVIGKHFRWPDPPSL